MEQLKQMRSKPQGILFSDPLQCGVIQPWMCSQLRRSFICVLVVLLPFFHEHKPPIQKVKHSICVKMEPLVHRTIAGSMLNFDSQYSSNKLRALVGCASPCAALFFYV